MSLRHLFLLTLLTVGCEAEQQDLTDVCMTCPAVGLPTDALVNNPTAQPVEEVEVEEVVDEIDEAITCPTEGYDAEMLDQIIIALTDHSNKGKFILWENTYGGVGEPDNIRVVYEYMGVRYTLWYHPTQISTIERGGEMYPIMHDGLISVWERPVGTYDDASIDTYSDNRFTGCVNFAIGHESRYGADRRYMKWNDDIGDDEGVGYHADWQVAYNNALHGLKARLGIH